MLAPDKLSSCLISTKGVECNCAYCLQDQKCRILSHVSVCSTKLAEANLDF